MTRAFAQVGLAVAIVLAPTLCCCKAGWLSTPVSAHRSALVSLALSAPVESCCPKVKKTCCDETTNTTHDPAEKPLPTHAPECACCVEPLDAALPEGKFTETAPRPTGEYLALVGLLSVPEHLTAVRGFHPPARAGDARYSALFERHVLRC